MTTPPNDAPRFSPGTVLHGIGAYADMWHIVLEPTCKCCYTLFSVRSHAIVDWSHSFIEECFRSEPVVKDGMFQTNLIRNALPRRMP